MSSLEDEDVFLPGSDDDEGSNVVISAYGSRPLPQAVIDTAQAARATSTIFPTSSFSAPVMYPLPPPYEPAAAPTPTDSSLSPAIVPLPPSASRAGPSAPVASLPLTVIPAPPVTSTILVAPGPPAASSFSSSSSSSAHVHGHGHAHGHGHGHAHAPASGSVSLHEYPPTHLQQRRMHLSSLPSRASLSHTPHSPGPDPSTSAGSTAGTSAGGRAALARPLRTVSGALLAFGAFAGDMRAGPAAAAEQAPMVDGSGGDEDEDDDGGSGGDSEDGGAEDEDDEESEDRLHDEETPRSLPRIGRTSRRHRRAGAAPSSSDGLEDDAGLGCAALERWVASPACVRWVGDAVDGSGGAGRALTLRLERASRRRDGSGTAGAGAGAGAGQEAEEDENESDSDGDDSSSSDQDDDEDGGLGNADDFESDGEGDDNNSSNSGSRRKNNSNSGGGGDGSNDGDDSRDPVAELCARSALACSAAALRLLGLPRSCLLSSARFWAGAMHSAPGDVRTLAVPPPPPGRREHSLLATRPGFLLLAAAVFSLAAVTLTHTLGAPVLYCSSIPRFWYGWHSRYARAVEALRPEATRWPAAAPALAAAVPDPCRGWVLWVLPMAAALAVAAVAVLLTPVLARAWAVDHALTAHLRRHAPADARAGGTVTTTVTTTTSSTSTSASTSAPATAAAAAATTVGARTSAPVLRFVEEGTGINSSGGGGTAIPTARSVPGAAAATAPAPVRVLLAGPPGVARLSLLTARSRRLLRRAAGLTAAAAAAADDGAVVVETEPLSARAASAAAAAALSSMPRLPQSRWTVPTVFTAPLDPPAPAASAEAPAAVATRAATTVAVTPASFALSCALASSGGRSPLPLPAGTAAPLVHALCQCVLPPLLTLLLPLSVTVLLYQPALADMWLTVAPVAAAVLLGAPLAAGQSAAQLALAPHVPPAADNRLRPRAAALAAAVYLFSVPLLAHDVVNGDVPARIAMYMYTAGLTILVFVVGAGAGTVPAAEEAAGVALASLHALDTAHASVRARALLLPPPPASPRSNSPSPSGRGSQPALQPRVRALALPSLAVVARTLACWAWGPRLLPAPAHAQPLAQTQVELWQVTLWSQTLAALCFLSAAVVTSAASPAGVAVLVAASLTLFVDCAARTAIAAAAAGQVALVTQSALLAAVNVDAAAAATAAGAGPRARPASLVLPSGAVISAAAAESELPLAFSSRVCVCTAVPSRAPLAQAIAVLFLAVAGGWICGSAEAADNLTVSAAAGALLLSLVRLGTECCWGVEIDVRRVWVYSGDGDDAASDAEDRA